MVRRWILEWTSFIYQRVRRTVQHTLTHWQEWFTFIWKSIQNRNTTKEWTSWPQWYTIVWQIRTTNISEESVNRTVMKSYPFSWDSWTFTPHIISIEQNYQLLIILSVDRSISICWKTWFRNMIFGFFNFCTKIKALTISR